MSFFKKGESYSKEEIRLNIDLLHGLKCIACKKYMSEPIRQCFQGHSSCQKCISENICGKCGDQIVPGRNLNLESIAKKVKYPCCNAGEGCNGLFYKFELDRHERTCGFCRYPCLVNKMCGHSCQKENMFTHVTVSHPNNLVMAKSNFFSIRNFGERKNESFVRLVRAFNEVFWCHHIKDQHSAFWAIQYMGSDSHCDNFTYDVKVHHPEDKKKYMGFKKVNCLRSNADVYDAFQNLCCVKIYLDVAGTFVNEEGHLNCSIKLRKCTPPKQKSNDTI